MDGVNVFAGWKFLEYPFLERCQAAYNADDDIGRIRGQFLEEGILFYFSRGFYFILRKVL